MRKTTSGFTIIEVLVVIAVIGILTTISVVSFGRYQSSARDSQRSSRATIITEALEKYYDANGEYPSCAAIQGTTVSADTVAATVLPGIQTTTLVTPQAPSSDTNSIRCQDITSVASDPDIFAYVGDGSASCTSGVSCLAFTLKYKDEITGTIKTIESRRTTDIATSGTSNDLVAGVSGPGFQTVQLNWSVIANASSYLVQRGPSNCSFSSFVNLSPSPTTNSAVFTGLTPGTGYCFRIAPVSLGITGAWSNTVTATTRQLATPVISTADSNLAAITVSWPDIAFEQAYVLEFTTVNGTWSNTPIALAANTTSRVVTGLSPGTNHFFRLQATATTNPSDQDTSNYSTVVSRVAPELATPVVTATATGSTSINITWPDILYETSYTLQYTTSSSSWTSPVPITISGLAANSTSRSVTGLAIGTTYYFRLQATATTPSPGDTSNWSATSNATTIPNPPVCSVTGGSTNTQIVPSWAASVGATSYTVQYGPSNYGTEISGITANFRTIGGLNNGTLYTSRVRADVGAVSSAWTNCPNRTTGVDGPSGGWTARAYGVRAWNAVTWMPGDGYNYGTWWTNGMYINAVCSGGATPRVQLQSYYAYSNNTSPNGYLTLGWTSSAQDRYVTGGTGSWRTWWHGWLACEVGGVRYGETYLGNAGPYG